ncbi:acetyltransferase [Pseudoalteromonas sp. bablab_jr004]|uniref:acetyltransferase n=1 Tax=Pseudoalteromonas sp. bablab_jr004 TaxID=2755065 RepID=UPI0018F7AAE6|nr:acetyltransferase [Pseudoalteromonas sp. bablab_jr004]
MKSDIILIGAGGHCRSCIDIIELTNEYNILGILDSNMTIGSDIFGFKILGKDEVATKYLGHNIKFLITIGAIGNSSLRSMLYDKFIGFGFEPATIVSPLAYVSKRAEINTGTVVGHGAIINSGVKIGKNCIVNTKALVEHDTIVKDHCHISTGAIINGSCEIGSSSFIGTNATLVQCTKVKKNSFLKAGRLYKGLV